MPELSKRKPSLNPDGSSDTPGTKHASLLQSTDLKKNNKLNEHTVYHAQTPNKDIIDIIKTND